MARICYSTIVYNFGSSFSKKYGIQGTLLGWGSPFFREYFSFESRKVFRCFLNFVLKKDEMIGAQKRPRLLARNEEKMLDIMTKAFDGLICVSRPQTNLVLEV